MFCIAHRGASGYAPENTRAAFARALDLGADAIETDVQLIADGSLVLCHDELLDRTSDGQGPVADHTLAELRALDFGAWYGADFAGERIMTVAEALDEFAGRIAFALELKDPRVGGPLARLLAARGGRDNVFVRAFSWGALLDARAANPALPLGYLTRTITPALVARCARRGLTEICPHIDQLTADDVARAHDAGLRVHAWGVGRRDQLEHLFAVGADGAGCNWPDWIIARRTD